MNQTADKPEAGVGEVQLLKSEDARSATLRFSGAWVQLASMSQPVADLTRELDMQPGLRRLVLQTEEVTSWDSRLPTYLVKLSDYCQQKNIEIDMSSLPEGVRGLLALARAVPERVGARRSEDSTPFLARVGKTVQSIWRGSQDLLGFLGEMILAFFSLAIGKARFRRLDLGLCIQEAGVHALPIVSLISLLVGLILAFVGAVQLSMFGAQVYIADLVSLGTVREMGALMTAVIMSGRTGAAYAAQLGTMNVNSEIDALKTMGISPMEFLVLPRVMALVLMMPLLSLYADLMGILGGAVVTVSAFDISLVQYANETIKAVHLSDFIVGLVKSLVFAVLMAMAGCMRGMKCGRSASAVGDAATKAVVDSIVYIVVADSIMTLVCNQLDI